MLRQALSSFFAPLKPSNHSNRSNNGSQPPLLRPPPLQVHPKDELELIVREEGALQTTLQLTHPGGNEGDWPISFKIKTTQPRRYLVNPNQGIVRPGQTVEIQILVPEGDETLLLRLAARQLGSSGLDQVHRDKLLVLSTRVEPSEGLQRCRYGDITKFWNKVQGSQASYTVNKCKLGVKFVTSPSPPTIAAVTTTTPPPPPAVEALYAFCDAVMGNDYPTALATPVSETVQPLVSDTVVSPPPPAVAGASTSSKEKTVEANASMNTSTTTAATPTTANRSNKDVNSMTQEELKAELTSLRGKYDDLVTFSNYLMKRRVVVRPGNGTK